MLRLDHVAVYAASIDCPDKVVIKGSSHGLWLHAELHWPKINLGSS
jgi:hypothetical protein